MSRILIILALLCACAVAVLGFGWFGTTATVLQVLGCVGLALAFRFGADLA